MSTGDCKSSPYTNEEKLLLLSLVDLHSVVKNKKTDAATVHQKQQEWKIISQEYNSQVHIISTKRNANQLKKLWSNLKQRKRKATTELKYNRLTGGSPQHLENIDPVMEAVEVESTNADICLPSLWDSTAAYEKINRLSYQNGEMNENEKEIHRDNINMSPLTSEIETNATLTAIETEANLRVQKLKESIEHQLELHEIRMQIEKEQLQIARVNRSKAEAEEELVKLQLQLLKKENNL